MNSRRVGGLPVVDRGIVLRAYARFIFSLSLLLVILTSQATSQGLSVETPVVSQDTPLPGRIIDEPIGLLRGNRQVLFARNPEFFKLESTGIVLSVHDIAAVGKERFLEISVEVQGASNRYWVSEREWLVFSSRSKKYSSKHTTAIRQWPIGQRFSVSKPCTTLGSAAPATELYEFMIVGTPVLYEGKTYLPSRISVNAEVDSAPFGIEYTCLESRGFVLQTSKLPNPSSSSGSSQVSSKKTTTKLRVPPDIPGEFVNIWEHPGGMFVHGERNKVLDKATSGDVFVVLEVTRQTRPTDLVYIRGYVATEPEQSRVIGWVTNLYTTDYAHLTKF